MRPTQPSLFVPHGAPTFALRPGAAGAAIVAAVGALSLGRTYLCPEVSAVVVNTMRGRKISEKPQGEQLGRREREVLKLLAEGSTSPEIASVLNIATSTVEVHRRNIMAKLDLHSVAELTKYAIRQGITST